MKRIAFPKKGLLLGMGLLTASIVISQPSETLYIDTSSLLSYWSGDEKSLIADSSKIDGNDTHHLNKSIHSFDLAMDAFKASTNDEVAPHYHLDEQAIHSTDKTPNQSQAKRALFPIKLTVPVSVIKHDIHKIVHKY